MLEITKVLVISDEIAEYKNIKNILEPLDSFELNYSNSLEYNSCYYDLVIADLDSFNDYSEKEILKSIKQNNTRAGIVFFKGIENNNKVKKLGGINFLPKPVGQSQLIECIYQTILEDISKIL